MDGRKKAMARVHAWANGNESLPVELAYALRVLHSIGDDMTTSEMRELLIRSDRDDDYTDVHVVALSADGRTAIREMTPGIYTPVRLPIATAEIRGWQAELGLTYSTAADALGISRAMYANYVSGRYSTPIDVENRMCQVAAIADAAAADADVEETLSSEINKL